MELVWAPDHALTALMPAPIRTPLPRIPAAIAFRKTPPVGRNRFLSFVQTTIHPKQRRGNGRSHLVMQSPLVRCIFLFGGEPKWEAGFRSCGYVHWETDCIFHVDAAFGVAFSGAGFHRRVERHRSRS